MLSLLYGSASEPDEFWSIIFVCLEQLRIVVFDVDVLWSGETVEIYRIPPQSTLAHV